MTDKKFENFSCKNLKLFTYILYVSKWKRPIKSLHAIKSIHIFKNNVFYSKNSVPYLLLLKKSLLTFFSKTCYRD